jgi:plastocyanin
VSTASAFSEAKALAILLLATTILMAACSSSDSGGSTPIAPAGSLTFTITSAGISPKTLTVGAGSQVTFVNNDGVFHEMFSDPHPEHMDCPEINQVGYLSPGQARQTGNLNTIRTCGFHDHNQPLNTFLQGSIVIR